MAQNQMTASQENIKIYFYTPVNLLTVNMELFVAIGDLVGTLSEPNMDAFNDVMEHVKKKPQYAKSNRNTDRCKNTAKTQIVYDSLMVLNSLPSQKQLVFYVDGKKIPYEDDLDQDEDDTTVFYSGEALSERFDNKEGRF